MKVCWGVIYCTCGPGNFNFFTSSCPKEHNLLGFQGNHELDWNRNDQALKPRDPGAIRFKRQLCACFLSKWMSWFIASAEQYAWRYYFDIRLKSELKDSKIMLAF